MQSIVGVKVYVLFTRDKFDKDETQWLKYVCIILSGRIKGADCVTTVM